MTYSFFRDFNIFYSTMNGCTETNDDYTENVVEIHKIKAFKFW